MWELVLVCVGVAVQRGMYQRKVDLDMLIKIKLADVSSVSPSSEQRSSDMRVWPLLYHSLRVWPLNNQSMRVWPLNNQYMWAWPLNNQSMRVWPLLNHSMWVTSYSLHVSLASQSLSESLNYKSTSALTLNKVTLFVHYKLSPTPSRYHTFPPGCPWEAVECYPTPVGLLYGSSAKQGWTFQCTWFYSSKSIFLRHYNYWDSRPGYLLTAKSHE